MLVENMIIGIGIRSTISISKTIKIIAKRKNRRENGIRALWFGSNPHSNGEAFSRSELVRIFRIHAKINRIVGIIIATIEEIIRRFIN